MHSSAIAKRLFIVGSSRSGTTLLQVSVEANLRIRSFPETFFLQELTRYLSWISARLGAPTGRQHIAFARFLREIKRPEFTDRRPSRWAPMRATVDAFFLAPMLCVGAYRRQSSVQGYGETFTRTNGLVKL